jgi:gliding motility-associated protein GldE
LEDHYYHLFTAVGEIIIRPITFQSVFALLATGLLLVLSALISGAEVSFFSLSPKQIDTLKQEQSRSSIQILDLLSQPKHLLSTILICNNFVNICIVFTASYFMDATFDFSHAHWLFDFLIKVIVVTFLLLLFGEIIPKVYATVTPMAFSHFMAFPMLVMQKISAPLSLFLIASGNAVNKRISSARREISVDDLSHALNVTESSSQEERKMLESIVRFGNIEAKNIMKPRVDVSAVSTETAYDDLLKFIEKWGYSRIPVYEGSFDNIKGILFAKDLLLHLNESADFDWLHFIREPFFVHQSIRINELLQDFKQKKVHLAIVTDEYGGTSGLVTMEDVIEEIMGEIQDELDELEQIYTRIDDSNYSFEGKTLVNDFCKIMGLEDSTFDDIGAETLAGIILETYGEIPKKGETFDIKDFVFTIQEADSRRVKRIKVTVIK